MSRQRTADIVAGCVIALLGAVVVVAASQIRGDVDERLPPRTLPYVVGFMTLAGGAALAVTSWRFRGEDRAIAWPGRSGALRIGVALLLFVLFIASIETLGMPVATACYVAVAVFSLDRKRIVTAVLTGAASGVVVHYLFIKLLELSFPPGFLER